jgi:hypothetical protein
MVNEYMFLNLQAPDVIQNYLRNSIARQNGDCSFSHLVKIRSGVHLAFHRTGH